MHSKIHCIVWLYFGDSLWQTSEKSGPKCPRLSHCVLLAVDGDLNVIKTEGNKLGLGIMYYANLCLQWQFHNVLCSCGEIDLTIVSLVKLIIKIFLILMGFGSLYFCFILTSTKSQHNKCIKYDLAVVRTRKI